ncbi:MAG: radical SAM protein, partial [Planctomycetes bacterium]|nr:radical SAM protein [Planctomycetota bacterium]
MNTDELIVVSDPPQEQPVPAPTPDLPLRQRVERTAMGIDRLSFKNIFYHVDKLHEYLSTGDAYPLHILIGLTDYCNHSCRWCYTAYSTHDNVVMEPDGSLVPVAKTRDDLILDPDVLLRFLREAREKGLRGASLVGSGEPLLHPQSAEIMHELGKMEIDFGIFTNGNVIKDPQFDALLKYASYVRFSLDAADAEAYSRLHGKGANFERTLANLKRLIDERGVQSNRLPTIGAQYVTSQLNADGMVPFARLMREIGVDYVSYKPMYDNVMNPDRAHNTMSVEEVYSLLREVKKLETSTFEVYDKDGEQFKEAWGPRRTNGAVYYQKCMSHQFSCALYAQGDIYVCVNLAGRKEFVLGNIYEQ